MTVGEQTVAWSTLESFAECRVMDEAESLDDPTLWQDDPIDKHFNIKLAAWVATSPAWPELKAVDRARYRAIKLLRIAIYDQGWKRRAAILASPSNGPDRDKFMYRVILRQKRANAAYEAVSPDMPELRAVDRDSYVAVARLRDLLRVRLEQMRRDGVKIPADIVPTLKEWPVMPHWPGLYVPDGEPGYTHAEALASVGPGWAALVRSIYMRLTNAGCRIVQVKEKFAGLRVYFDPPNEAATGDRPLRRLAALTRWERWMESRSYTVCESCGALGTRTDRDGLWRTLTLCADCTWRWREGANSWSEIRGEWSPDDPETD
jgi:hypothetical protein